MSAFRCVRSGRLELGDGAEAVESSCWSCDEGVSMAEMSFVDCSCLAARCCLDGHGEKLHQLPYGMAIGAW